MYQMRKNKSMELLMEVPSETERSRRGRNIEKRRVG